MILLLKDLLLLVFIILALGCGGLPRKTRFAVYLQKICASKDSVSRLTGIWMVPWNACRLQSITSVRRRVVHHHMLAEHSIQGVRSNQVIDKYLL